jgi:manganese/zinc/iron transport system substrate-binding protein
MTRKIFLTGVWFFLFVLLASTSCRLPNDSNENDGNARLNIVTTTTLLTDLVLQLCGDSVNLEGLMGAGVDPHLYKPTEGDVFRIINADIIFYNGLLLEGRMDELFQKMRQRNINTIPASEALSPAQLLKSDDDYSQYDPHIWLSIENWKLVAAFVAETIAGEDETNRAYYMDNLRRFLNELDELNTYARQRIAAVPSSQRVLITAHDAFGYFGHEFGLEVIGLQGISTATETGAADVRNLADLIYQRRIPSIFVETSVSDRNIRALREAVASRGFEISIGGTLYSDALGSPGTPEGTYIGMFKHNVTTITDALK